MNIKKISIIIAFVTLLSLSFLGGYKYSQKSHNKDYTNATKPADALILQAVSENPDESEIKKIYENTTEGYRTSNSIENYINTIKPLGNSEITNTDAYIGSLDNVIIYNIETKSDKKKYHVSIGTAMDDKQQWKVSSIIVSEQQ